MTKSPLDWLKIVAELSEEEPCVYFGTGYIFSKTTKNSRDVYAGDENLGRLAITASLGAYLSVGLLEQVLVVDDSMTKISEHHYGWRITPKGKSLIEKISSKK